jgi:Mrp family chromosome partitioning ATPase
MGMAVTNGQSVDPTVLSAVWRYRWLVLFLAVAFGGLGWLYASQTAQWTAEATLAIQDPRSSNLFDQGSGEAPQRYVERQVAILQSRAVAREAVDIAAAQTPPIEVTVTDIVTGLTVGSSSSSDIVTLGYTADTQRVAIGVVNAVATAYQDLGSLGADAQYAEAIEELDRSIDELEKELVELDVRLSARWQLVLDQLTTDPNRLANQELVDELVQELFALDPPDEASANTAISSFNSGLQVLTLRIEALNRALEDERTQLLARERDDPERLAIVARQSEAQRRLADMKARSDQLAVDSDLASSGVAFYSPAETASPSGAGLFVALGTLLGLIAGSAIAMALASRRRRFASRTEPEQVLGIRLLADVPNFKEERVGSTLPVLDAPASASAEAFRFVSASISLQQLWPASDDGSKNFKSLVSLSAGLAEGKTVVTANTAFAAAREGHKVLLVDADFGNQQLTELILGDGPPGVGMTDIVAGGSTLGKAVTNVPQESAGTLDLLSRGTAAVRAPDFFSTPATAKLFQQLSTKYDLVLIDAPPLLRVAYATTLARLADRGMVIVAHGEDIHAADELRDQIELVGIPLIGYVYNIAPLRAEMAVSAGSMADTLGEYPAAVSEKP